MSRRSRSASSISSLIGVFTPGFWLGVAALVGLYLLTHLYHLTVLPAFADETIYIRWAQLVIDDWRQYLFFSLNDGKTPLQVWLMIPWQFIFSDQLWAGRWLSVLAGLGQLGVTAAIIKSLGGRPKTILFGMVLTAILPFWYFHHRMALIDGLLTLWISLSVWGAIKVSQLATRANTFFTKAQLFWMGVTGVSFGLALFTKVPAILVAPSLVSWCLYPPGLSWKQRGHLLIKLVLATGIGVGLFALLRLHPAFGQLFGRGSDFLYPWQEVVLGGKWQDTIRNIPTYVSYLTAYLSWPVLVLTIVSVFSKTRQRTHFLLLLGIIAFAGPIALLGKVVYPRYFLPVALWMTVSAVLFLEELAVTYVEKKPQLFQKLMAALILTLVVVNVISVSARFMAFSLFKPNDTPFVSADQVQYLHEWSAGYGLEETVALINQTAQTQTVAVATEGRFGTLPDGLLMYFHRRPVDNIYIEGIGYPVKDIPEFFKERARDFELNWLVVNSHRLEIPRPEARFITEFCRPHNAPCLQIWDISDLVQVPTATPATEVGSPDTPVVN